MGKTFRRVVTVTTGAVAAWAFAIRPRLRHKPDMSEIKKYDYAHRGYHDASRGIPENSIEAFRAAIEHGYGIVMDVRVSRDGVPFVFRDSRLSRMCGTEGTIENSTSEELSTLRLQNTEEAIPTLEDALDFVDGQVPVLLNLHVEAGNYQLLSDSTCDVVDAYDGVFAIQAFDPRVLRWFKDARSSYVRGQVVNHNHRSGYAIMNRLWDLLCNSLFMNFLTAPDFVTTNIDNRRNPSIWLCRVLYRVPRMDWVVSSLEDYELVKTDGSLVVFEDIEP